MDAQKSLKQAWEILKLKEPVMHSVAADPKALAPALILVILSVLFNNLGQYFFPISYGSVSYQLDAGGVFVQTVIASVSGIAFLYMTGFLAERLFHSKLSMQGYVRVMGYAALIGALALYPILVIVSGVWTFVVFCYVLSKVGKLSVGSIILLILLEILILGVFYSIFADSAPNWSSVY